MTAADPLPQPESATDAGDHERTAPPDRRHRTPQQSVEFRADDSPGTVPLRDTPVVLDTDIGADADDAFALAVAALSVPQLCLVLTSDELPSGKRARFARHLLNQLGRAEVLVVVGPTLEPAGRQFCVADLIPPAIPTPPTDVVAVRAIVSQTRQPIRWIGCGPASNLARIVRARPEWATRLRVTQMGGRPQMGQRRQLICRARSGPRRTNRQSPRLASANLVPEPAGWKVGLVSNVVGEVTRT